MRRVCNGSLTTHFMNRLNVADFILSNTFSIFSVQSTHTWWINWKINFDDILDLLAREGNERNFFITSRNSAAIKRYFSIMYSVLDRFYYNFPCYCMKSSFWNRECFSFYFLFTRGAIDRVKSNFLIFIANFSLCEMFLHNKYKFKVRGDTLFEIC